jgi:uncharacterized protein involved in response to NO
VAFAAWSVMPGRAESGWLLIAAGLLNTLRLARWAGDRTFADRLVLVLHVAYVFVPAGFVLTGLSILRPDLVPASAGIHAWTAGAIGMMTLAVMTRASLGHTGQPLVASAMTQVIYGCAFCAAILRIASAFTGDMVLMHIAAAAWVLAFAGFAGIYGPRLVWRPPAWSGAS